MGLENEINEGIKMGSEMNVSIGYEGNDIDPEMELKRKNRGISYKSKSE